MTTGPTMERLLQSDLPHVHLFEQTPGALDALRERLRAAAPAAIVRIVRGRKARTSRALFDELAAALQLPLHFGENWDALEDVLRDLPGSPHVLLVSDAGELLADEDARTATLFQVLARAHAARPFHVIVQERPGPMDFVEDRLRSHGILHDRL